MDEGAAIFDLGKAGKIHEVIDWEIVYLMLSELSGGDIDTIIAGTFFNSLETCKLELESVIRLVMESEVTSLLLPFLVIVLRATGNNTCPGRSEREDTMKSPNILLTGQ